MSKDPIRPRSAGVPQGDATATLKAIYKKYDADGSGTLTFEEFFAILRRLNGSWSQENVQKLFQTADQDLSGYIEFDEFVDYLNGDAKMDELFKLEDDASEEEAKEALLLKPHSIRSKVSKQLKARGLKWSMLTWTQRLQEVRDFERTEEEDEGEELRMGHAPSTGKSSSPYKTKHKAFEEMMSRQTTPTAPENGHDKPSLMSLLSPKAKEAMASPMKLATSVSMSDIKPKKLKSALTQSRLRSDKFGIAAMNQVDIVKYSITNDDLAFTGWDKVAMDFREHLKTAPGPLGHVDILKFIAKGTAGFVFLASDKESGVKVALKLIRMTQARTGVREWYISKKLMEAGVQNVVYTFDSVFVLDREECPPVVDEQLRSAGPVPFYMCMVQDCMPWGTLEDLANDGELSPGIMFQALYDVASTLAEMHANRVQHKDVKPENIMLQMEGDVIVAAKLCDLGSSEVGENPKGCADDVRRFGVTMFSVATGEGWTKNKLIRANHDDLVARLGESVANSSDKNLRMLPDILKHILQGGGTGTTMREVADIMKELSEAY
mmetsp:Transcript_107823/g.196275  ORF Transcript_107823/g.196275 Transcript_107823/m.196275 type:complete len:550 (+) Transcript_107823:59-1708(+)